MSSISIVDSVIDKVIDSYQMSISTRDINNEREFEYDVTEDERNTMTLLLLCKLALITGNL